MAVTIHLPPQKEAELIEQARTHGLSVEDWLLDLAARAVEEDLPTSRLGRKREPANLPDLLIHSPFAGANLDLERLADFPRPGDLE